MRTVTTTNAEEAAAVLHDSCVYCRILDSETLLIREEDIEEVCQMLYCLDALVDSVA